MGNERVETTREWVARVRAWLGAKTWSQSRLAKEAGVEYTNLNKILRGRGQPLHGTVAKIERVMGGRASDDPQMRLQIDLARLLADKGKERLVLDLIKTIRASDSNNAADNGGDLAIPPASSPPRQHGAETTKRRPNTQGPRHPKSAGPLILLYAASSA